MTRLEKLKRHKIDNDIVVSILRLIIVGVNCISIIGILCGLINKQMCVDASKWFLKWSCLLILSVIGMAFLRENKFVNTIRWSLMIGVSCIVFPWLWFTNGGSANGVQFYAVLVVAVSCILFEGKYAILFIIYNVVQLNVFYYIQEKYPQYIQPLHSPINNSNHIIDINFTLIGLAGIVLCVLNVYKRKKVMIDSLNDQLAQETIMQSALIDIMQSTKNHHKIENVCTEILSKIIQVIPAAKKGSIMHIKEDGSIIFQAVVGYNVTRLNLAYLNVTETFFYLGTEGAMDQTTIVDSVTLNKISKERKQQTQLKQEIGQVLCAPIHVNSQLWGIINIDSKLDIKFSQLDINFLTTFKGEIEKIISFSEIMRENNRLRNYDYLTNTYNRLRFNEKYNKMVEEEHVKLFTLVIIDLDKFKRINDLYGHHSGDLFLKQFVLSVKKFISSEDIFSRFGGDEFQLIIMNQNKKQAQETMCKIVDYCNQNPMVFDGNKEYIRFSFGMAEYPLDGEDEETLSLKSDKAMYGYKSCANNEAF